MHFPGTEKFFDRDELIVSKTDVTGKITYANHTFLKVAGYEEDECVGQQHNLIRNPNMPRAVFKLLWDTVATGKEIFAYVVNTAKGGDHYWVIAHVTPSFENGEIVAYHSTRRVPNGETVRSVIMPLYEKLLGIEQSNPSKKDGMADSVNALLGILSDKGVSYDELMASLMRND